MMDDSFKVQCEYASTQVKSVCEGIQDTLSRMIDIKTKDIAVLTSNIDITDAVKDLAVVMASISHNLMSYAEEIKKKSIKTLSVLREEITSIITSGDSKITYSEVAAPACVPKMIVSKSKKREVFIAPDVSIKARFIHTVDECKKFRGSLCYMQSYEMFCVNIESWIFYGKIGDILHNDSTPTHHFEYSKSTGDPRTVNFYMSPLRFPNSTHIRTWTNRMRYVSAGSELRPKEKYAYRIGSRSNLASDLADISSEDARLARDYFTSLMLVLFVMASRNK